MSYDDDVALVLGAMGLSLKYEGAWWYEGLDSTTFSRIDANFIVERVIPWASLEGQGITLAPRYAPNVTGWRCFWSLAADSMEHRHFAEAPTMPEAVMAAIAQALRSTT